MSSSFGGGGRGDIRYVISVDDSQAIQKFQNIGQTLQGLQQSGQQATQGIQQLPTALNETATSADNVAKAQQRMEQETVKADDAVKRQNQTQQSFGSVVKQNIGTIISMASGVLGLVSSYTGLQRTQLAINKLTVTEANQRRMLDVLTRKHAEAVAKYGANSQEALDIESKINILQAKHTNTLDQLNIRQEQQTQQQIAFGISVIQTGASLVQMVSQLKTYSAGANAAKVATTGLSMSMNKLKIATVIGAILVGIEVAAQAVANNFGGLRDRITDLYNWLVKLAPAFRPVIDAIWTIGQALTALFTGDIDSLTKMFSQSAAAAPAAVGGVDDMGEAIGGMGKEAGKAQKEIDDMWKEISEAPNLTSALNIEVDKDKLTKKLLDYLPDSLTKDIKVFIKGRESVEALQDSFKEILSLAADMGKDDKWANNFVKKTIKVLKEKFPNAPGSKELQAALALTISGPDTLQKAKDLMTKWKLDPDLTVEPTISFATTNLPQVQTAYNKFLDKVWEGPKKGGDDKTGVAGMLEKIKTSITEFDWKGTGEKILKGIFALPSNLSTVLKTFVDPITNQILVFLLQDGPLMVSEFIAKTFTWENVKSALTSIATVAADIAVQFFGFLSDPKTTLEGIKTFALNALNGIGDWLKKSMPQSAETLAEVGEMITNEIYKGFISFANFGSEAINWIYEQLTGVTLDDILKVGEMIIDELYKGLIATTSFGANVIKFVADQITDSLKAMWQVGADMAGQIWEGMKSWFSGKNLFDLFGGTDKDLEKQFTARPDLSGLFKSQTASGDLTPERIKALELEEWNRTHYKGAQGVIDQLLRNSGSPVTSSGGQQSDWWGSLMAKIIPSALGLGSGTGSPNSNPPVGDMMKQGMWVDKNGTLHFGTDPNAASRGDKFIQQPISDGSGRSALDDAKGSQSDFVKQMQSLPGQQQKNMAGAGVFDSMIKNAAAASKGIQTEFSSMFTALQGIFTGIATHWSAQMNSLPKNAKSGYSQTYKVFITLVDNVAGLMNLLAKQWSFVMNSLGKNAKSGGNQAYKALNQSIENVAGVMNNLGTHWSKHMNTMGKNAKSGGQQIYKALNQALENVAGVMNTFAKHWSKVCNSLINNAKSAASGINSALSKIKDVNVTVHVGTSGATQYLAKGGIISAARGYTTNGPQLLMVGDNPGGRETIAAIPNNAPAGTMGTLNRKFGTGGSGGDVVLNLTLPISGNEIINERKLSNKIRFEIGRDMDKFG